MINNISELNSIANRFVAQLREVNVQKDRMRFRQSLERLSEIFAFEISKQLQYKEMEIETPLGVAQVNLPVQRIVLATIFRAGIPMHQGMLRIFDDADSAFVSAYRKSHKDGSFEIALEYSSCPNLDDCVLIITDPMLATGASMHLAIEELLRFGKPQQIHIVSAIAAAQGLDYVRRTVPSAVIWLGALDEELTAKSYIVPGLGDAGDLAFGPKVQE